PRGLGIDGAATPLVALVLGNVRKGVLPVEVTGNVEWLLNRTANGWLVTLLNPAGNHRLQHGVGPTDYAKQRTVVVSTEPGITLWTAREWFTDQKLSISQWGSYTPVWVPHASSVRLVVPAGAVRIVEIRDKK